MKPSEAMKNLLNLHDVYHHVNKETAAVLKEIENGDHDGDITANPVVPAKVTVSKASTNGD